MWALMEMLQNYVKSPRKLFKNTNRLFLGLAYCEVHYVKYGKIRVFSDTYFPA